MLKLVTGIVLLITALVSLAANFIQLDDKRKEIELRRQAEARAEAAELGAKQERAARINQESRRRPERDSVQKFLVDYQANLFEIRNASSILSKTIAIQAQEKIPPEKIQALQQNLTVHVNAFIKFLGDWPGEKFTENFKTY